MRKIAFILGIVASALIGLSSVSNADIIAQFGAGSTGSGFAAGVGQSVTTPDGGPWENITFNFYNSADGTPQAEGNVYLLSAAYTGTPQALSLSTPGFLGVAAASGSIYTFDPSLTLAPDTQYFFYCDTRPGGPGGTTILGDGYAGGTFLKSPNGSGSFTATASADVAFSLEGVAVATPEPSTIALGFVGLAGFALMRRRYPVAG
jgi:hypothetical protein